MGNLGGERDMEEGLGVGNLDCTFGGQVRCSDTVRALKMGIFAMPFLFPDYAHANAIMDGPHWQAGVRCIAHPRRHSRHRVGRVRVFASSSDQEKGRSTAWRI